MSETNGKKNGKADKPTDLAATGGVQRDELGRVLPGSVLNPRGRGASYRFATAHAWNELLDEHITEDDRRTNRRALMEATLARALGGDVQAMKLIWDRIWPASIHADVSVSGMTADTVLNVFQCMRADYIAQGRLSDIGGD